MEHEDEPRKSLHYFESDEDHVRNQTGEEREEKYLHKDQEFQLLGKQTHNELPDVKLEEDNPYDEIKLEKEETEYHSLKIKEEEEEEKGEFQVVKNENRNEYQEIKLEKGENEFQHVQEIKTEEDSEKDETRNKAEASNSQRLIVKAEPVEYHAESVKNTGENINSEKPYKCGCCGKMFKYFSLLVYHMRQHHGSSSNLNNSSKQADFFEKSTSNKDIEGSSLVTEPDQGSKDIACDESDKIHKRAKQQCIEAAAESSNTTPSIKTQTGDKPFKCGLCDKTFSNSFDYTLHARTHSGKKPYKCSQCERRIKNYYEYTTYSKIKTINKPYKCNHCFETFTHSSQIATHMRTHDGETLSQHTRSDIGDKPYKCSYCNKSFAKCANLANHIRTHIKIFKCKHCDK